MKTYYGRTRIMVWAFLLISQFLATGCVHPKVTYVKNPTDDETGSIKFRLAATRVLIGESTIDPKDSKKRYVDSNVSKSIKASKGSILEVPREDESEVYSIIPQSQWLWTVETKLSATYFDNTRLVQKMGTQVEDNRIKIAQAIGSVATAAIALAAGQKAAGQNLDEINIPTVIDADPNQKKWLPLPGNPGWFYLVSLKNAAKEPDSIDRNVYFKRYSDGFFSVLSSTRTFPISSCREANLEIGRINSPLPARGAKQTDEEYYKSLQDAVDLHVTSLQTKNLGPENTAGFDLIDKATWPLTVADYNFIRTYELPDKGSISAHTLCGADITTEKSDAASTFEVLAEMVKQAKAIKDSQKK